MLQFAEEVARLALFLPLLASIFTESASLDEENVMVWHEAKDSRALCNDYSRAGFFLRRNSSSDRWIIFLESGSLCFSSATCNRRFFRNEVKPQPQTRRTIDQPFGDFDPVALFDSLRDSPYQDYVNPSMTSMKCLRKSLFYTTEGGTIAVKGRDILSPVKNENEDFYSHNHVLIPYCSSDLWLLGSDLDNRSDVENTNCNIFSGYSPGSTDLQFAFRGQVIFRSIFEQLMQEHNMSSASSILLSGSSAGGLGAINQAQWVKENIPLSTELKLLIDSAWFVNFHGNIEKLFKENTKATFSSNSKRDSLLNLFYGIKACNDTTFGYPCCFSSQCMLTRRNASGNLAYFPESNVKMFFISSRYDAFILAPSLIGRDDLSSSSEENTTAGLFNLLTYAGEYGGEMSSSLSRVYSLEQSFSYYLTQCFQHIYLATSTLWTTVFNTTSIGFSSELVIVRHSIKSGRWKVSLAGGISIQEAVRQWYSNSSSLQTKFRDSCDGPYCNKQCPESFATTELMSNSWSLGVKVVIAIFVLAIGIVCVILKCFFGTWLLWLEKKQNDYLDCLDLDLEAGNPHMAFPVCEENNSIAVSCLNLSYTISYKTSEKVKDERSDKTNAIVLSELEEQENESIGSNFEGSRHRHSGRLRKKSTLLKIADDLLKDPRSPTLVSKERNGGERTNMKARDAAASSGSSTATSANESKALCGLRKLTTKQILKNISIYFNPGEMIGIMGPSGCGKTTLLDIITGRRQMDDQSGYIYVNGVPLQEIRDWYTANTGYVLQLARPYYEELTVRENVTLAAEIKLPVRKFTTKDKLMRVEQVLEVTGLSHLADTVVGGETGPGLSGGQKRRLVVALQLLRLPSVIFLDEPTSGLDATSSMELLSHLNKLADSNRTVILTIHQPRLEIFHMFHKLVLLSDGRVAYHGAPEKAYEVFVSALRDRYLDEGLMIPLLGDHNPADVIMDMLGNPKFRKILTDYYQDSNEPKLVRQAITSSRIKTIKHRRASMESFSSTLDVVIHGARKAGSRHANFFVRLAVLEARAAKRLSSTQIFFLPFIFCAFGLILGTVYFQQDRAYLVISGMCVFSVASGIFVFPAIEPYYLPAIRVYSYERADGIGRSQDLVLQGFIRYVSVAFIPVIGSTALAYFLLVNREAYDALVFLQVVLVNLCLNFTWTALLIALLVAVPRIAFRLSSTIASVAGFTSGFFIPINNINWAYRWMAYINPNYYGLSSVAFLILEDYNLCTGNQLTCYFQSGAFTLRSFFFDQVNPYLHITILLGFTLFFLCLGVFANWVKYTSMETRITRIFNLIINKPGDEIGKGIKKNGSSYEHIIMAEMKPDEDDDSNGDTTSELGCEGKCSEVLLAQPLERVDEDSESLNLLTTLKSNGEDNSWDVSSKSDPRSVQPPHSQLTKRPTNIMFKKSSISRASKMTETPFLREGERHIVMVPTKKKSPRGHHRLASSTSDSTLKNSEKEDDREEEGDMNSQKMIGSLRRRQRTLQNRVRATQTVLKESNEEILNGDERTTSKSAKHWSLLKASTKVSANLMKQRELENRRSFFDVVSQYTAQVGMQQFSPSKTSLSPNDKCCQEELEVKTPRPKGRLLSRKESSGAIPIVDLRKYIRDGRQTHQGQTSNHNSPSSLLDALRESPPPSSLQSQSSHGNTTEQQPLSDHSEFNEAPNLKNTSSEEKESNNPNIESEVICNTEACGSTSN